MMHGARAIVPWAIALWVSVSARQRQVACVVSLAPWWEVGLQCVKPMEQLVLRIFKLQIVACAWPMCRNVQTAPLSLVMQQIIALSQTAPQPCAQQTFKNVQMVAMSPAIQRTIALSQSAPQLALVVRLAQCSEVGLECVKQMEQLALITFKLQLVAHRWIVTLAQVVFLMVAISVVAPMTARHSAP